MSTMNIFDSELEETMLVSMHKHKKLYFKYLGQQFDKYDLSPNETLVLFFLKRNPKYNTAKDIMQYLEQTKGLISRSVESLSNKGYISTEVDMKDKRVVRLYITEKGQPFAEEIIRASADFTEMIAEGITNEEMRQYAIVMNKMAKNLRKIEELSK